MNHALYAASASALLDSRRLLLIRHARTRVMPALEPASWPLHPDAPAALKGLADQLHAYRISNLVTSSEPKAVASAELLGRGLSLAPKVVTGLHEHERGAGDFDADRAAFERRLSRFFQHPDELLWGRETANQALARFAGAVDTVLGAYPDGNIAIVAHGTVISLLVSRHNPVAAMSFWRGLGMPACVVLTLPGFRLERVEAGRA